MAREFEQSDFDGSKLLCLFLVFLYNDVRECVDQPSLGSLFSHFSGQQGGVSRMSLRVS